MNYRLMKTIKFLLCAIFVVALSSCHHTSEPLNIPQQYTQLNTVIAPWQKDNDLLPWKGQLHTMIINSIDDVYATQTERFIEENPNWLQVDFTKETIIAVRTILFAFNHWQYTSVTGFYKVNYDDEPINYYKGDYQLPFIENYTPYSDKDDEDESQYRIYQIAIVTNKIPSDARVHVSWSQNLKASDVWD